MVSLKDIAGACGVSVATVSKALNDQNDVSKAKKEEIRKVAKEMGYFPNSAAKTLKTNKSHNIGVLLVDGAMNGLTHDYFASVLDGFKRNAEEQGYDITFMNCSKSRPNRMSYLEHARYRGFDGVAIACIDFNDPEVVELVNSDIPVVTIDYTFNNRMSVISDNIKGMQELTEYVVGKGHKRLAYIHGETESAVTQSRLSSFFRIAEAHGITVGDEYIKPGTYRDTSLAHDYTIELLDMPEPPTCIFYPDDFACIGGMNAIWERGLKIPEDISVVGYDGIKISRHISPKITTLRQDTITIGATAAEGLINLIERPKTTPQTQVVVTGEVFEGQSVGMA